MSTDFIQSAMKVLGLGSITNADSGNARIVDMSLGSRGTMSAATLVSGNPGTETVNLVTGPARVYGMTFFVSAAGSDGRWNLIDATGSAEGGSAKFTFIPVAVGYYPREFLRPLKFDRGLQINYTATGTSANFTRQIFYSAV